MYLDYDFYINNGGDITDETAFNTYNRQAENKLDAVTVGNLKNETVIGDIVKYCIMDIINYLANESKKAYEINGVGVKSLSNNGISMSVDTKKDELTQNTEISMLIQENLSNYYTEDGYNVLFRGVK